MVTVGRKVERPRQQSLEQHNIILYHLVITNTYCSGSQQYKGGGGGGGGGVGERDGEGSRVDIF